MKTLRLIVPAIAVCALVLFFILQTPSAGNAQTSRNNSIATAYAVSVVKVGRQVIEDHFSVSGTIVANNDVTVLSETQGRVVKVNAEVGDYRQAGSVLVEVDSELREAAFKAAKVSYEKATKDLERAEELFKQNSISQSQIETQRWGFQSTEAQYIVARRQFSDTKITTPISGIVTARFVNIGTMVMGAPQATAIANVVDISKLKVKVSVAEKDVFKLKKGEPVEVTTDVFPGTTFMGTIFSISAKGDDAHTYPIEVVLKNTKQQLRAGMFGRVTFAPKVVGSSMVLPREAIVGSVREASVYVVQNSTASFRSVTVGKEFGTSVEILSGVQEGEIVVVNGQNNLRDNAPVIVRK